MEEGGKRKIVLRRAPPAFGPPPPSNPTPLPPPRALKTKSGAAKRALSRAFGALFIDWPSFADPLIWESDIFEGMPNRDAILFAAATMQQ